MYGNVGGAWGGATDDDSIYSNVESPAQNGNPKEERGYKVRYISILYAGNYIVYTLVSIIMSLPSNLIMCTAIEGKDRKTSGILRRKIRVMSTHSIHTSFSLDNFTSYQPRDFHARIDD